MIPALTHASNCPVGGNFACTCGAEEAAMARLAEALKAFERLREMTPQALVNLALEHMPDMPYAYEQVVEELCTRVYPNWSNEDPPQLETKDDAQI
jgi:hypothetical protein